MPLEPGLAATVELVVGDDDTAVALGSGDVPVLATPRVVALVEEASVAALASALADGETTVGVQVQLDHLAAIRTGRKVKAEATLKAIKGRQLMFTVSVHDPRGLVAVGKVTRVIVDRARFLEKAH